MTTEQFLTAASGWAISASLKYLPWVRIRFDKLNGLVKRLIVIAFSLIFSLAVFALKCGRIADVQIVEACTRVGWLNFANIALTVAINSQAAYLLLPNVGPGTIYRAQVSSIPDPFPRLDDTFLHG